MRKLDKSKILSTKYKAWEETLENNAENHPKYNSTSGKYFTDIFTNLLNIQGGLCAYTEKFLCKPEKVKDTNWIDGRFKTQDLTIKPFCKGGNLEHFNPDFKKNKAWLWDNLFFVDTDVNNYKSKKPVSNILKPDTDDYDEFKLLEYDKDEHIFIANVDLEEEEETQINDMIETLGINLVKDEREVYFEEKIENIVLKKTKTWQNTKIYQFPTAFEMIKKQYSE